MSHIQATICGLATSAAEKRTINSNGQQRTVANFGVAVNRGRGDQQKTDFVRVAVWGQAAERLEVEKGDLVTVFTGDLHISSYTNQQGQTNTQLECTSNWVEVGQRKQRADQQGQQAQQGQYNAGYNTGYNTGYGQQAQQAPQGQYQGYTQPQAQAPQGQAYNTGYGQQAQAPAQGYPQAQAPQAAAPAQGYQQAQAPQGYTQPAPAPAPAPAQGYQQSPQGFMQIPDGIDENLPFTT